jgi:hypothetical protein
VAPEFIPPYTKVAKASSACKSDISKFTKACDSTSSTQATCSAFLKAEETGNAPCFDCLYGITGDGGPTQTGAILANPGLPDFPIYNIAGCIATADPSSLADGGASDCPAAYEPAEQCVFYACVTGCGSLPSPAVSECVSPGHAGEFSGPCAKQVGAAAVCLSLTGDGGVDGNGGACSTYTGVVKTLCGR